MSAGRRLRKLMHQGLVLAPFVYDGFTARIAEAGGARAVYMTGHGISAQLGFPDVGLLSFAEMVENVRYIVNAVDVPVIADADTGYGNPINTRRTVQEYEAAGVAALHLEDQVFPKKCGFFEGKEVVPRDEHVQKIRAALDARSDTDLVIIARTDALAPNGWDDALDRARAYHEAGADLVFVDGIRTGDDLARYTAELVAQGVPCLYNGGLEAAGELGARGFKLVITGGGHFLSFAAVRAALVELKATGSAGGQGFGGGGFDAITDLLGLPEVYELEERYAAMAGSQG